MEHDQEERARRQDITLQPRDGLLVCHLGALSPAAEGCVVEFAFTVPAVPPDTRTAAAITLLELDGAGRAFPRGMRTLLLPAHHSARPTDIQVEGVRFILPPELDLSEGGPRRLVVRAEIQYVDFLARCTLQGEPS